MKDLQKIYPSTAFLKIAEKVLSFRIRLLPVVVFSASILLTAKISLFINDLNTYSSLTVADSWAEKASAPPEKPKETGGHFSDMNPSQTSLEEYKILQALKEQQQDLQEREKKLPEKEATLQTIEKKIEEKTKALEEARLKLEELVKQVDEKENVNLDRLVKMAESMKPNEAAPILEGIDFAILIEIMEKIKPAKASPILASMEPKKAAYLMTQLALRKKLVKS